jgi:hypothetical protein
LSITHCALGIGANFSLCTGNSQGSTKTVQGLAAVH